MSQSPKVPHPPRWAQRLMMQITAAHLQEIVLGDLEELFTYRKQRYGATRARYAYLLDCLLLLHPRLWRAAPVNSPYTSDYPHPFFLQPTMIRNYLKIAWRNLINNKVYSVINIGGLALGMACSLLIGLWVQEELSYDRFLPGADQTYFVRFNTTYNGEVYTNLTTPGPLQEAIGKDIPQVAAVTKLTWNRETLLKVGQSVSKEFGRYAAGDFFGVFALPVLAGNPRAALAQPDQIVITRKVAERFFPQGKALGKQLQFNNDKFYTIGAVVENMPTNSTVQFDWLVNFKVQEQDWMTKWGNNSFLTYARIKPNTTASQAEAAMKNLYARYSELKEAKSNYPILQPITSVHLYSAYKNGQLVGGQIEYVRIFSLVAIFILLIACINFMNLATARSAKRAKEVGVRKVVGAQRASLIGQFISESVLTSLLAVGLALLLTWLVLPTFNQLFDKTLTLDLLNPDLALRVLGLVLVTGLLSGSYPALYLSGLQPIRVLKGALRIGTGPTYFRRALVVFQFSLAIFLIVGMLAVGRQMNYLRTKSLGLDRGNLLYVPVEGELTKRQKTDAFRQEVMRLPSIASATTTTDLPIDVSWTSGDLTWPGKDPGLPTDVSAMMVGGDFVRTMKIKLLAGRDFQSRSLGDSTNYLINEAAAKLMGFKDPIGREIDFTMGKGKIIGLMKDFHLNSLHQAINPLVVSLSVTNSPFLLARAQAGQTQQAIADLERLAKQVNPNYPFTYHFVDEAYEKLYQSEQQVSTLVNYFAVLTILISCLGLFGLAAFTAEQRTKEIGVRKVLGASVGNIVELLSTEFLRLVLIALVVASPVAWWALSQWLHTFEYREELAWWLFGLAGMLALLIAFSTVAYQSVKAALLNPVETLRAD